MGCQPLPAPAAWFMEPREANLTQRLLDELSLSPGKGRRADCLAGVPSLCARNNKIGIDPGFKSRSSLSSSYNLRCRFHRVNELRHRTTTILLMPHSSDSH